MAITSPIDADRIHGLIVSDTVSRDALAVSGFSFSGPIGAAAVAIVDGSGAQITSFGGGTQYTDGGVPPAHPVGGTIEWSDGANWQTVSTAKPLPVTATFSPSGTQDVNLTKVGGSAFALGQALAAASIPVVLTAAQITTLTPPSNTGYALDSSLSTIDTDIKSNITLHAGTNVIGHVIVDSGTTNPTTPTAVVAFVTAVTTAGTRVQLASNAVSGCILQAPSTNTGLMYIGGSTVSSTVFGAELQAGQSTSIAIDNTNKIYIDSSVNGEKVAVLGS